MLSPDVLQHHIVCSLTEFSNRQTHTSIAQIQENELSTEVDDTCLTQTVREPSAACMYHP